MVHLQLCRVFTELRVQRFTHHQQMAADLFQANNITPKQKSIGNKPSKSCNPNRANLKKDEATAATAMNSESKSNSYINTLREVAAFLEDFLTLWTFIHNHFSRGGQDRRFCPSSSSICLPVARRACVIMLLHRPKPRAEFGGWEGNCSKFWG